MQGNRDEIQRILLTTAKSASPYRESRRISMVESLRQNPVRCSTLSSGFPLVRNSRLPGVHER